MRRFNKRLTPVSAYGKTHGTGLQLGDFGESYSAKRQTPALTPELHNEGIAPFVGRYRNQGLTSACGGFAISDAEMAIMCKIHRSHPAMWQELSAMDAYWKARPPNFRDEDNGVLTRDIIRVLNNHGACAREIYPDDASPLDPPAGLDSTARFKTPRPFQHVRQETVGELAVILHTERLPAVLLLTLFQDSVSESLRTGVLLPPKKGDALIGGHATCATRCRHHDGTLMVATRFNWGALPWGDGTILIHPDYFKEGHVVALAPPPNLF